MAEEMTFEQKMAMMKDMSPEDIQAAVEENKRICKDFCGECPSYTGTGETELLFCALGKSDKITEKKGCICGTCPVQKNMSLRWAYYCTKGTGREILASEQ